MGMCCPPQVEPPTPEALKCRRLLQVLAVALLPVAVMALVAGFPLEFFIFLFLLYFLFMSWRIFSWCSVIIFFLYCFVEIIQATIGIAGYVQYSKFFSKNRVPQSIYLVISEIYFIFAIFISHYVYRIFRSQNLGEAMMFNRPQPPAQPEGGQYRPPAMNEELRDEGAPMNNRQQQRGGGGDNAFRGQGVRIG